jgi:hypothetical protein
VEGDETERDRAKMKPTRMADKTMAKAPGTPRSAEEVERASIRSLNVHMKAVARVIQEQSICTDISLTVRLTHFLACAYTGPPVVRCRDQHSLSMTWYLMMIPLEIPKVPYLHYVDRRRHVTKRWPLAMN